MRPINHKIMDFKKINAPTSTVTYDREKIDSQSENIYKAISIISKRTIQINEDIKKELITNFKFKKENIVSQLNLVSREEFDVLKKLVEKQDMKIKKLTKKTKRAKKP